MSQSTDERLPADARSVGELLHDADVSARTTLWDVGPDLAKPRVRAWVEMVDAAARLWFAIPDRSADPSMRRIHERVRAMREGQQSTRWPGRVQGDPVMVAAAESLRRAGDLVGARRHPTAPLSEAGDIDAEAARTRLMHAVYVASHAVVVTLDHHIRDLRRLSDARRAIPAGESLKRALAARDRANTIEQLASDYLEGRWPKALAGERRERPDIARLEQATARWGVQAFRSLAGEPNVAALVLVAETQRNLTWATARVGAALAAAVSSAEPDQKRYTTALARLEHAWSTLDSDLTGLMGRRVRPEPELLSAANEIRAALREITHGPAGLVSIEEMASLVDIEGTTRVLHRSVADYADIARAATEVLDDHQLTAPATAVHALATSKLGSPRGAPWVDPADMATRRDVALPAPVRSVLAGHAEGVVIAARTADSALSACQPRGQCDVERNPSRASAPYA